MIQNICMFLQKDKSHWETTQHWATKDPSTTFLATGFIQKMLESPDSMYSSIFMLKTCNTIPLNEVDWIREELFQLWIPGDSN